ncbi:MAG TPA: hypothetical protein GXX72_03800, partial [Clostridiaceae bacterium]|nr:hypothetical protein [Clostridiaceae bacterium]
MKKWWVLTKALIKGSDVFGMEIKQKKRKKATIFSKGLDRTKKFLLGIAGLAYMAFAFGMNGYMAAGNLLEMGFNGKNPGADPLLLQVFRASLSQLYLPGFLILLGMGFFYAAGIFFFAEDLDTLLALPIKPSTIVAAKLSNLYVFSVIVPLMITIPAVFALGIRVGMSPLYYIYALMTLAFGSVIPMCIDAILILLMMRTAVFAKSKDRFMIITQVLMFIGIIAFVFSNIGSSNMHTDLPETAPAVMKYVVPLSDKAIEAISLPQESSSLLKILGLVAIALVMILILVILASVLYLRSARESRSTGHVHKPMTKKAWQSLSNSRTDFTNMIIREFKILYRSPTFLMNILVFPLLMVFIFLGTMLFGLLQEGDSIGSLRELVAPLLGAEQRNNFVPLVLMVLTGIAAFVSGNNACMPTAISREGRGAGMLKSWPIKMRSVFLAKLLVGEAISLFSWLPVIILLYIFIPFNIYFQPLLTMVLLLLPSTINVMSLLIDLRK